LVTAVSALTLLGELSNRQ